jgi:autotransporter-associated beta strand protein
MKTRVTISKLLIILCSTFATTAVFGQTIYTWTGAGDGTNIVNATNWTPAGGPPSGSTQDTAQWDNQMPGNLTITYNNGLPGTGFGTSGINIVLTSNQVGNIAMVPVGGSTGNIGINNINISSGAGSFALGDANDTTNILNFVGRPAGGVHDFVNDSTNPAVIYPNVRWQAGGGSVYTLQFDGTGNWFVTNSLFNANNTGILITMQGSGTLYWNGPSVSGALGNSSINSPITINAGTVVLEWNNVLINNDSIQNYGNVLEYNAPAQTQILTGVISGSGELQVNNGTLDLKGQNVYTNTTLLTGGTLIVDAAENAGTSGPLGVGGTISFAGGTLQFSVNNTFDYSSRFSTASNQAFNFNTGGQLVVFTNALSSSGGTLTESGPGTLTLSGASTYSGTTTIKSGKLVFQGPKSGSGNISVADGAALGVTATGTQITPGTLTLGTTSGATLEFNNVTNTTTAPLAPSTLSSVGTVTITINSGTFTVGQSYPLLTWTSGSAPSVSLGTLNGFIGNVSFSGNKLLLNITASAYKWTGANNGNWDTTTPNNWIQNGGSIAFANGGPVLFDDTASGSTSVTVASLVQPSSVTVNNSSKVYSITSSSGKDIGGIGSFTKSGTNTLTLSGGANTFTGVTTINSGTVSVGALANGGSASDIGAANNSAGNLVLNGGALQYTGAGASSDRLFTLGSGGGTIDSSGSGTLTLTNAGAISLSGTGARLLTLTGSNTGSNILAASLSDNSGVGATSLTKSGAGNWVLAGNNTYSGGTTISGGELVVGTGGASGSLGSGSVVDDTSLDFNVSGTVTVGVIGGLGSVTNDGSGTVILAANNTYTGGTTINAGTLQVGNGGATGSLASQSPIVDNGTLVFNTSGTFSYTANGLVSGTGQVIVKGSGLIKAIGANTYTGNTTIFPGATFQPCEGNQGALASPVVTNNGTFKLVRQDTGVFIYAGNIVGTGSVVKDLNNTQGGDVTLTGTNTYTGGTSINGGAIILGDGATTNAGSIVGNVSMTYNALQTVGSTLEFNRPDDFTFSGAITGVGSVTQNGFDTLTLTGTNTYAGSTTINNGTVQVGVGGTSGAIGASTNAVTDNGTLVFNRSDNVTYSGVISGAGSVVQLGSGTLTLAATNTYSGPTTVSNGTLAASSIPGDMDVSGGTLTPGGVGSVSTLNVAGNMNVSSGTVLVSLNKALSPSNSVFSVAGIINFTNGTLKLLNFGPNLAVGDKFTIFSEAVTGGAAMTIASPGFTVSNNLAVNGSVTVTSISASGALSVKLSAGQLILSWPASSFGLHLESQTNPLTIGLSNNWVIIPGTDAVNGFTNALNQTNGTVFYRLAP